MFELDLKFEWNCDTNCYGMAIQNNKKYVFLITF